MEVSNGLKVWLKTEMKGVHFPEFLDIIQEQHDHAVSSALVQGDTEYQKGAVVAYRRILELPDMLIKELDKANDTIETLAGKD